MRRCAVLALPVVLAASSLTGCGLFDGSSSLEEALETLPAGVTRVTFDERSSAVGPAVEWEVVAVDGDRTGRVQKLTEDVDLDDLDDDLTLVRGERLVVSGALTDEILEAVDDDIDSLIDDESFQDLVDSTDDVEYAVLARSGAVCGIGDPPVTPRQAGVFVHGDDPTATLVLLMESGDDADELAEAAESNDVDVEVDDEQVRADLGSDDDVDRVLGEASYPGICSLL